MRNTPSWRIPVGVLGLVVALGAYALLVTGVFSPMMAAWPVLAQAPA